MRSFLTASSQVIVYSKLVYDWRTDFRFSGVGMVTPLCTNQLQISMFTRLWVVAFVCVHVDADSSNFHICLCPASSINACALAEFLEEHGYTNPPDGHRQCQALCAVARKLPFNFIGPRFLIALMGLLMLQTFCLSATDTTNMSVIYTGVFSIYLLEFSSLGDRPHHRYHESKEIIDRANSTTTPSQQSGMSKTSEHPFGLSIYGPRIRRTPYDVY